MGEETVDARNRSQEAAGVAAGKTIMMIVRTHHAGKTAAVEADADLHRWVLRIAEKSLLAAAVQ